MIEPYLDPPEAYRGDEPPISPLGDELEASTTPPTIITGEYETFLAAFKARGLTHLGDLDLDPVYLDTFLTNFCLRIDGILQKYRAGQLEHGGDIRDRDLRRERAQEIDDLLVYDTVENTCRGLRAEVMIG